MPFEKLAVVYPGRSGSAHKIGSQERDPVSGDLKINIFTYVDRAEMEKQYPQIVWSSPFVLPKAQVREALLAGDYDMDEALERWVIANSPIFSGATYIGEPTEEETLESARVARLAEVTTDYNAAVKAFTGSYSTAEQRSWFVQLAEAEAYTKDPAAATPWIDSALAGNGREKAEFVAAILANSKAFTDESGRVTGLLQKAKADIAAAETVDAVKGVTWNFSTATTPPSPLLLESPAPAPAPAPAEPALLEGPGGSAEAPAPAPAPAAEPAPTTESAGASE